MEAALRTLEDIPLKGLNLRLQKVEPFLIVVFGIFEERTLSSFGGHTISDF